MTYFGPALDPPLGGSGWKTTTLVKDYEYFIPTKFHQYPSSGSGEEVENVKILRTDGRRTDRQTDRRTDGRRTMTIAHSSLRLRWAKKIFRTVNLLELQCLSHTTLLRIIDNFLRYQYSNFTLWVTQFNFALSDENRKYSHMIDYHVILRAIYWSKWQHVQTRGGHNSEQGKKRNETSVIGCEERKKNRTEYDIFTIC